MSEIAAQTEELHGLITALASATKEVEKAEKATALYGNQLDKLKELAIGATGGEETVEKYKKAKEAFELAGNAAATKTQRVVALAAGVRFAAGAVGTLAGRLSDFGAEARKASAELYLYDQRMRGLGRAADAVRRETAGAADAQVAFNTQQELAARGVQANATQQAILARAVREVANARQISQEQASAVVQRALDGDAAAAAQLGVNLQGATTNAARLAAVTQQLGAQQQGSAVATRNAAEEMRAQEQASERAWGTIKKLVYESSGLSMLEDGARGLNVAWDSVRGTLDRYTESGRAATEADAQRTRQLQQQRVAARQAEEQQQRLTKANVDAANIARGTAVFELERLGHVVSGLGEALTAEQQYQQALAATHDTVRRVGESDLDYTNRRTQAAQALLAAIQRRSAEEQRADTLRNTAAETGMLAEQIRRIGGVVDARIRSVSVEERLVQIRRELANFAQRENEDSLAAAQRQQALVQQQLALTQQANQRANEAIDTRNARAELRDALNERADLHAKVAQIEARAGESALERLRRQVEAQRELNQLAQDGADQAEAAFQQFREQTRERLALDAQKESERMAAENAATLAANALAEENRRGKEEAQRGMDAQAAALARADAFDQRLRDSFGLADEQARTVTQSMADGAKVAYDGFGELASGIASATLAAAQSGEDVGAAVAKYVDQWATAKAVQWGMQAGESIAGVGLAYLIRPDAVPGLLASAATYGALALGAGVTAAAIPNAPAASSGAGNGAASNRGPGLAASSRNETGAGTQGPAPVIFNVSGFTSTESAQEGIVRALKEARLRGLIEG